VRYEVQAKPAFIKGIQKLVHQLAYQKESSSLKANSKMHSDTKSNGKGNNSDAGSWRKGSVASGDKIKVTDFKRERFNSEGNSTKTYKSYYPSQNSCQEELEIDLSNIKYSLSSN
jgi:hypothetical protein